MVRGVESDPEKVLKQWITIGYHIDRFLFFKLSQKFRESKVDVLYNNIIIIFDLVKVKINKTYI